MLYLSFLFDVFLVSNVLLVVSHGSSVSSRNQSRRTGVLAEIKMPPFLKRRERKARREAVIL